MAYVDFSDFRDGPAELPADTFGTQPVDRTADNPTVPGGTVTPIGTGPITTQPQPRATTATPTVPGANTPTVPGRPGYTGPAATSPLYVPTPAGNSVLDKIANYFLSVSGGAYKPTQYDVNQWGTNIDDQYLSKIQGAIYRWWQTRPPSTPAATTTTPGTSTGDPVALIRQYQASHPAAGGAALDDLVAFLKQNGIEAKRYVDPTYGVSNNELDFGQGKYKVYSEGNGTWYQGGNDSGVGPATGGPGGVTGAVNGNTLGYDDPSAQIYLTQLASRLNQLNAQGQQPDPFENLLKLVALLRVNDLNGAPYTSGEDAALVAHYMNPLTQARDASLERNKERIGSRGMAPTSGLLDVLNRDTEHTYEQGVAGGANDLAVRAVAEKQRRADEQLQILNSILGVNRTGVDRKNDLADRAVALAKMFPDFDQQRLNMLLTASGENPSATGTLANLNNLTSLGLDATKFQTGQDQANAQYWGQLIAGLIGAA
jgi:hypothetical protein